MVHLYKMMKSPRAFPFFQNFDFLCCYGGGGGGGGGGQKIAQNNKRLCLLCSISREPYIIWLSIVVHKSTMIMSLGAFFICSKFWFFGLLGGSKGEKLAQNDKKLCPLHFISHEPYIIWSWFMVHLYKKIISPGFCYIFPKFQFLGSIVV